MLFNQSQQRIGFNVSRNKCSDLSGVNYSFRSTTTIIPDSCWNFFFSSPC
jgi:hypothetical protein